MRASRHGSHSLPLALRATPYPDGRHTGHPRRRDGLEMGRAVLTCDHLLKYRYLCRYTSDHSLVPSSSLSSSLSSCAWGSRIICASTSRLRTACDGSSKLYGRSAASRIVSRPRAPVRGCRGCRGRRGRKGCKGQPLGWSAGRAHPWPWLGVAARRASYTHCGCLLWLCTCYCYAPVPWVAARRATSRSAHGVKVSAMP